MYEFWSYDCNICVFILDYEYIYLKWTKKPMKEFEAIFFT